MLRVKEIFFLFILATIEEEKKQAETKYFEALINTGKSDNIRTKYIV